MSNTSDLIELFNKYASSATLDLINEFDATDEEMYEPPTESDDSDSDSDEYIDEEIDHTELYDLMNKS